MSKIKLIDGPLLWSIGWIDNCCSLFFVIYCTQFLTLHLSIDVRTFINCIAADDIYNAIDIFHKN